MILVAAMSLSEHSNNLLAEVCRLICFKWGRPMNSEHVIEVREVTKKYGTVVAVDALSFEVQRGEIFAFLGPTALARRP